MVFATDGLNDASLWMTVDRTDSFGCPRDLATDLAALFFGLAGIALLEEAVTRLGPPLIVFLFFSTIHPSNDTGRISRLLTYSEKALQGQEWSIRGTSSWVNAVAVEWRRNQMGQ